MVTLADQIFRYLMNNLGTFAVIFEHERNQNQVKSQQWKRISCKQSARWQHL